MGADLRQSNVFGFTPFHSAMLAGQTEVALFLAKHAPSVIGKPSLGWQLYQGVQHPARPYQLWQCLKPVHSRSQIPKLGLVLSQGGTQYRRVLRPYFASLYTVLTKVSPLTEPTGCFQSISRANGKIEQKVQENSHWLSCHSLLKRVRQIASCIIGRAARQTPTGPVFNRCYGLETPTVMDQVVC